MAIADKLQSILDSKNAIKASIEAKGVADVGDVLADYPSKIASIQSGGGGYTGHADVEGLKAIGWTDDDIEYYQKNGVNWNEEDDAYHKVPEDNIALYGVVNADNLSEYKDRIVYLPKIDFSGVTDMSSKFKNFYSMVAIPMLDMSKVTNVYELFANCYSLYCVSELNLNMCNSMNSMYERCYSIISPPIHNIENIASMSSTFINCYSLKKLSYDVSNVSNFGFIFDACNSIEYIYFYGLKSSLKISYTSLLQKDSLLYMINNEAATEPITITLSAYCYNKYNTDEDVTAALAAHPNVSLASA